MPASKPCLGYPSRTAAVIGMRSRGLSDGDIARKIGIDAKTVSALAISAEKQAAARTDTSWNPPRSALILPEDVKRYLRRPAVARGVSVYQLALTIVEVAATNGLVDAILDDATEGSR